VLNLCPSSTISGERMFGSVHSVHLGGRHLLRMLHDDQMRQFRQAPREEREKYAEQAARYRDMMNNLDLANLLNMGARYAGR
jgi:hypothetical protein